MQVSFPPQQSALFPIHSHLLFVKYTASLSVEVANAGGASAAVKAVIDELKEKARTRCTRTQLTRAVSLNPRVSIFTSYILHTPLTTRRAGCPGRATDYSRLHTTGKPIVHLRYAYVISSS